ncbi:MFS transporter [Flexivirga meconopsidis]|uniref:MFS transporter n=1 Tax=Flexivirga meconopsidis TaxID=2977121 RepID=UPI0022401A8E|nr:MFS transporter [Flexivirga meconopsidis]
MTNSRRWIAVAAIALTTLVVGLDTMVLNVALPTLAEDLHANISQLQWFTSAYTLALAVFMLPIGALGDRIGRRRVLLWSLVIFGGASLACAFAQTPAQLIAARAVLGIGAAALLTLTLAVLTVMFSDKKEQRRAISLNMAGVALGMPLGPLLGGWLLDHFHWGSVFLINVPVVLLAIVAIIAFVPESRSATPRSIHLPSVALSSLGLASLTYGFIEFGQRGWADGRSWIFVFVGVVLTLIFVLLQPRLRHPLVDLQLFGVPAFRLGAVYAVALNFVMFGVFFSLPQLFQAVQGASPLGSGLRLLPMVAGLVTATRLNDRIAERAGIRVVFAGGLTLTLAALVVAAFTSQSTPYAVIGCWMFFLGTGMGMVMFTAIGWAVGSLDPEHSGAGSALLSSLRQVGGTIGVAILGTVQATRYHSALGDADVEPVRDSVNAGVEVARSTGNTGLLSTVRDAFVQSIDLLLWSTAGIVALALISVLTARRAFDDSTTEQTPAASEDERQSLHVVD